MMWSTLIVVWALSKYMKLPVATFTAPTANRISPLLIRPKSTSRAKVSRNGVLS